MVSDSFAFAFSYDTSPAGICILRGLPPRPQHTDPAGLALCGVRRPTKSG